MRRIVLSLLLLLPALAGADDARPITIGETLTLRSEILGEERTIHVGTPAGYAASTERYPVLYLTDGESQFDHTRGTVDFLTRNGLAPPLIVVGVTNTDRTRDLTPTRADVPDRDGTPRQLPTSGGADAFLDFFEKELFPYIDENYRTQPYRLFAGHSYGGLFAVHAFATRPTVFGGVIAVSPSLRWDDDLPLKETAALLQNQKKLSSVLYVSMADEERDLPKPTRLDRLQEILVGSKVEGLEWQVQRFPDENHSSVVLRSHYWGLRRLFRPWLLPADPVTGGVTTGLAEVKAHYAGLSERCGFEIQPPENTLNLLGYRIMNGDDLEGALEVFRYNVELYPDAANVHDSLGEALERAGRLPEAFSSYSRAVERAEKNDDPLLSVFRANRDRVRQQI